MEVKWNHNSIYLCGRVFKAPVLSHESHHETFYLLFLESRRLSGTSDIVKVLCPSRLLEDKALTEGDMVTVNGALRSYNNKNGAGSRLVISVLALDLEVCGEQADNNVSLRGTLCKTPIYRKTPLGREISDMLLAVNRRYGRADYLPCIAWGAHARYCADCGVGTKLSIEGRLQSRVYFKTDNGVTEERTAYEISICSVHIIDDLNEFSD